MVIYGEYLFLENFIVAVVLLFLTAKITGSLTGRLRIFFGGALGGLGGFIIFLPLTGALSIALRIATGLVCILVTFGRVRLLVTTAIFMALTFMSGGAVMALLLWKQETAIAHQGIIYIEMTTYLRLACMGVLAFGLTYWFVKLIRRRHMEFHMRGRAQVIIEGKSYFFSAYIDSGNCLREPLTGSPVVLLDKKSANKLTIDKERLKARYRIIPYKAVGTEKSALEAIRTDRIILEDYAIEGAYVAFYEGSFGDFEVLINREFLERGLLQNG